MQENTERDDSWRFADQTASKLHKSVGVYGAELTPATMCKSVTGVPRGEELFHRPELYRPWRTPNVQKHAEVVVAKEQEIETLTKKCVELRSQLAIANRELQRVQVQLKTEVNRISGDKDLQIEQLEKKLSETKSELDTLKSNSEHQLRVLRTEHENDIKKIQTQMKTVQESSNEMGGAYHKQMQDVKAAAAREVELIQQLCHARNAELANELKAANESLRKLHERDSNSLDRMQEEMKRSEQRCFGQMNDQDSRYEKMRDTLQFERQSVEAQRDKALAELSKARENIKTLSYDLSETENRYKDWNVRLLSDLDQLHEYYQSVINAANINDDTGVTLKAPVDLSAVYNPPRKDHDHTAKTVMNSIAERLQQLTMMKQKHSYSTQAMLKKIQMLEATLATSQEGYQRQSQEKDFQTGRLQAEVGEAKSKQGRIEAAMKEMQEIVAKSEERLVNAAHRLQFFSDDLQASLTHMGPKPLPPRGQYVTFVATSVQGASVLWEKEPEAMRSAMTNLNDSLRLKMRQYGGYECQSEGDAMLIAFQEDAAALRFAMDTQEWVLQLNWPPEILDHHYGKEETALHPDGKSALAFRGLRVAVGIHRGPVELEFSSIPIGVGDMRATYFGRTMLQLVHIASYAAGGQIVASADFWSFIREQPAEALGHPVAKDLGEQRFSIAHRKQTQEGSYSSVENIQLFQLSSPSLAHRVFLKDDDSQSKHQGIAVTQQFTKLRRSTIDAEVQVLRNNYVMVSKAATALKDEIESVGTTITSLACKLRDAQIQGRVYSQADIVTHVATLDRALNKMEVVKADVSRVNISQNEISAQLKNLEDVLVVQTKVSMTEDEFKRRLEVVQERCNEKLYEASMQTEHKIQQFRNSAAKCEQQNQELRGQLKVCSSGSMQQALSKEKQNHFADVQQAEKKITTLQTNVDRLKQKQSEQVPRVGTLPAPSGASPTRKAGSAKIPSSKSSKASSSSQQSRTRTKLHSSITTAKSM